MEQTYPQNIAQILLDIGAITLRPEQPFTWTSGMKAPIYTDNRLIISYPKEREFIERTFAEIIKTQFPEADVIAGTATAGIPHAAIIADYLKLPMIYIRSSSKAHGKQNAVEGKLTQNQKVVIIEDLISTGGSVITAAKHVQEAGGEVIGCLAVFSYLLPQAKEAFAKVNFPLITLTDYQELVNLVTQNETYAPYKNLLEEWYHDPIKWTEKMS